MTRLAGADELDGARMEGGGAFVYHGSASGLSLTPAWTAEGDQAGAEFGWSLGTAGDVNGDGFDDLIVGARLYDKGQGNEGRAFVFHGSASGLPLTPNWKAESNQARAEFGWSVGSAGDVNGDGFQDVIVGALFYDTGQPDEGRAFVYKGSASGLSHTPAWTAEGDQPSAALGSSVGTARDVDGNGVDELVVGVFRYNHGEVDEGAAFVYGRRSKL